MSDEIVFILNGELTRVSACDPTRTVLQYLREDLHLTGSKEGCGEGDCGACMVVLAELDDSTQTLNHKAINACIAFLPTLHGKALFTIEALSQSAAEAHPVQRAMVDLDASQCGFCTPGFVMSLFAQYENRVQMSPRDIDDVLSGNLCRCTGYRPIRDAALAVKNYPAAEHAVIDVTREKLIDLQATLGTAPTLTMQTSGRTFSSPATLQALSALVIEKPDAQLLAGGTDIGLWVTKQHRQLENLIYLGNVASLKTIELTETELNLGAAVTWSEAMSAVVSLYPAFADLFTRFASVPIRNTATIGGNIANGSPIGDSMPALIVVGTQLLLRRGDKTRRVALDEFYLDYQKTLLAEGEFVEKIIIPRPRPDQTVAAYKVSKRFDQDISAVCGCFAIELAPETRVISSIKVAFGGMAAIPKRATEVEKKLKSTTWDEAAITQALASFADDFSPIDDMRASADYRLQVAQNLLRRFFVATTQPSALIDVYNYGR
ncbi:MAG: xanthine dehydrogenase small subunit [Pseudomonadaceae bacterium]|nr:xanthine dehydrogenase small subunit [Pseudomonadaceae bacterium]